jgi:diguanylate cyclase (GGDEF)-like protein
VADHMGSAFPTWQGMPASADGKRARRSLTAARRQYLEDPAGVLAEAIRCHELARSLGDAGLCASAKALQGTVSLHRGDLRGALELAVDAERHAELIEDVAVWSEVAALKAQLGFFSGSYSEALRDAQRAVRLADVTDDLELRIFVRRAACLVFGNVGVSDLKERIEQMLELTIEASDPWEEAVARNDLACYWQQQGDIAAAEREIELALGVAERIASSKRFVLGVLHSTRADIYLLAGRPQDALADAQRAIALLVETGEPNPYVLGVTVRAEVEARMALGQFDDAQRTGEDALRWLGDRVPQTRSLILTTLATTLRRGGRLEEAYDALERAAELERTASRELSELQIALERATLETNAARRESATLAAKNRELAVAHAELERRTGQLEHLQEQLRDQADRDWLTGLHNRRYLARELQRLSEEHPTVPLSLAVLDLDRFKSINDRFGHSTGDQVLIRVAGLLCDVLRGSDIIVRSGGEEFIVLMPETDARAAVACCERIREAIHDEPWNRTALGLSVTASVGVASTHDAGDLRSLVGVADQRLYEAKRAGRDRVVGGDVAQVVSG